MGLVTFRSVSSDGRWFIPLHGQPGGAIRRMGLYKLGLLFAGWLCASAVFGAASAETTGEALSLTCEGTAIQVVGQRQDDLQDVCRGVAAARTFMSSHGLTSEPVLTVEVTDQLPEVAGPTAVGCYLQANRRAYVKSYAAFKKEGRWFGIPVTRALYQSLATHETAHAVAACHFTAPSPSIQAKEYVAYVAMFSTMPEALRTRALKALPGTGFNDIDRVSAFVYLFNPMQFGANAYRHFQTVKDPVEFLEDVLSGMVLSD